LKKIFILLFALLVVFLKAENNYPIVLVHGFLGWGPEELGGYKYWGGPQDIEALLEEKGYKVFTVSVGPVSSNWERAIEVYTQLKGGDIDYGEAHANEYGIIQKPGKKYDGLYPEWDENHPVHLMGHSMGGQTIRMLQYQLSQVVISDTTNNELEQSELLGKEQNGWIASITSISTPHDGTTLANIVIKTFPYLQNIIGIANVVGSGFYDFDLEHWGFSREENETWSSYRRRMKDHPAWGTKNICAWDLSLEGAKELNGSLIVDPNVYYFSFQTTATYLDTLTGFYIPRQDATLLIRPRAKILGSTISYWRDGSSTDSTWYNNDGVVNTISMTGPKTGANGPDPIIEYQENDLLIPGQWYTLGPYDLDHWSVIGHTLSSEEWSKAKSLYYNHAKRLKNLPVD
jgi:triacylglycerol lipase